MAKRMFGVDLVGRNFVLTEEQEAGEDGAWTPPETLAAGSPAEVAAVLKMHMKLMLSAIPKVGK